MAPEAATYTTPFVTGARSVATATLIGLAIEPKERTFEASSNPPAMVKSTEAPLEFVVTAPPVAIVKILAALKLRVWPDAPKSKATGLDVPWSVRS
jgi:hypothetical protein